jgi:hypothetical protein
MSRELPKRYAAALRVFFPTGRLEVGWLTMALLIACLAVTILTNFGTNPTLVDYFSITRYRFLDATHLGWKMGLRKFAMEKSGDFSRPFSCTLESRISWLIPCGFSFSAP